MATRLQEDAYNAIAHSLPYLVKQLKIANELKAIELKHKFDPSVKAPYEWVKTVDAILQKGDAQ